MTLSDRLRLAVSAVARGDADLSSVDAMLIEVRQLERFCDETASNAHEDADMAERATRLRQHPQVIAFPPPRPGIRSARGPMGPGSGDAA